MRTVWNFGMELLKLNDSHASGADGLVTRWVCNKMSDCSKEVVTFTKETVTTAKYHDALRE